MQHDDDSNSYHKPVDKLVRTVYDLKKIREVPVPPVKPRPPKKPCRIKTIALFDIPVIEELPQNESTTHKGVVVFNVNDGITPVDTVSFKDFKNSEQNFHNIVSGHISSHRRSLEDMDPLPQMNYTQPLKNMPALPESSNNQPMMKTPLQERDHPQQHHGGDESVSKYSNVSRPILVGDPSTS